MLRTAARAVGAYVVGSRVAPGEALEGRPPPLQTDDVAELRYTANNKRRGSGAVD